MLNLRRVYEETISIPITYTHTPIDKINESDLPCQVRITVKEQGFYLLMYKINKIDPVVINLREDATGNKGTLNISNLLLRARIKEELRHSTEIFRILPEEITVPVVNKAHKTLPVKFAGKVGFAQQYNLSGTINIVPKSINVFGEKKMLDTMTAVYTEAIKFRNLNDTVRKTLSIVQNADLRYETEKVNVLIPIDKFTEKTVEIPVTGKNFPKNMEVRFFPSTVTANFFVTFSKFNSVNANNFEAIIDYKNINKNERQRLQITTNSPFVFELRTTPAEVEYLIEMKQ
jgi:hypothetical protein